MLAWPRHLQIVKPSRRSSGNKELVDPLQMGTLKHWGVLETSAVITHRVMHLCIRSWVGWVRRD